MSSNAGVGAPSSCLTQRTFGNTGPISFAATIASKPGCSSMMASCTCCAFDKIYAFKRSRTDLSLFLQFVHTQKNTPTAHMMMLWAPAKVIWVTIFWGMAECLTPVQKTVAKKHRRNGVTIPPFNPFYLRVCSLYIIKRKAPRHLFFGAFSGIGSGIFSPIVFYKHTKEAMASPSRSFMMRTPCVERERDGISERSVRMTW